MKGLIKKLKSMIRGWRNYFADMVSDLKYRDEFIERFDICECCEARDGNFCGECGCFIPAKTKSEDETCPLGKWKGIVDE